MKTQKYIVTIKMPDGDMISSGWLKDLIQGDCDIEDKDRDEVFVEEISISENLEEAAVDIADNLLAKPKDYALAAKADYWNGAHDGFIAGAQWQEKRNEETIKTAEDHAFLAGADWQKEQMLKDAVEGVVEDWNPEPHPEITIPLNPEEFTAGDKVKLIIVKED